MLAWAAEGIVACQLWQTIPAHGENDIQKHSRLGFNTALSACSQGQPLL